MKITNTTVIDIKSAQVADLPIVLQILSEAAAWLKEKGIEQWPSPPDDFFRRRVTAAVERGEMYTAGIVKNRLATVCLAPSSRHWPDDGLALYVSLLALRTAIHGQGLGTHLLTWARLQARRENKRFLRLDCLAGNDRLRRYYEEQGFVCRGQFSRGEYLGARYEQPAMLLQ